VVNLKQLNEFKKDKFWKALEENVPYGYFLVKCKIKGVPQTVIVRIKSGHEMGEETKLQNIFKDAEIKELFETDTPSYSMYADSKKDKLSRKIIKELIRSHLALPADVEIAFVERIGESYFGNDLYDLESESGTVVTSNGILQHYWLHYDKDKKVYFLDFYEDNPELKPVKYKCITITGSENLEQIEKLLEKGVLRPK